MSTNSIVTAASTLVPAAPQAVNKGAPASAGSSGAKDGDGDYDRGAASPSPKGIGGRIDVRA